MSPVPWVPGFPHPNPSPASDSQDKLALISKTRRSSRRPSTHTPVPVSSESLLLSGGPSIPTRSPHGTRPLQKGKVDRPSHPCCPISCAVPVSQGSRIGGLVLREEPSHTTSDNAWSQAVLFLDPVSYPQVSGLHQPCAGSPDWHPPSTGESKAGGKAA